MLTFPQHVLQTESPTVQKINIQDHLLGRNEEQKEKKSVKATMESYCFYLDGHHTDIYVYVHMHRHEENHETHTLQISLSTLMQMNC